MTATVRRVAVFATCLAEAFAPQVAEAAAELVARSLPAASVDLVGGGCCGQPAWNAGYAAEARALARRLLPRLLRYDLVVVPSGSCATMIARYYPHLFAAGDRAREATAALAGRTRELGQHLAATCVPRPQVAATRTVSPGPVGGATAAAPTAAPDAGPEPAVQTEAIAFHPSCHSLRGAFVADSGERCLEAAGCRLCAQRWADECCGFGGLFAAKEPALSAAMADTKLDALVAAGATAVVSGEMGCLLHLEGRARRRGLPLRFRHLAEVLRERSPRA